MAHKEMIRRIHMQNCA